MRSFNDYSHLINESLAKIEMNDQMVPSLYDPIRYTLAGGGKCLRPVLTLMSCDALSSKYAEALSAALGIEMFHNFTLLHDDVMDVSDLRRGRPTVHVKWNTNSAILSGDAMLTLATDLVMCVPDLCLRPVLNAFNKGAMDVYEGQAYDMKFESSEEIVPLPDYIRMISLKTGSLLGIACQIGALIGGADNSRARCFYDFGMKLGIAFQIHDDYLDMYGDQLSFGKPIGGDVQNNKQTFLLLTALSSGNEKAVGLREAMRMSPGDDKLNVFREIYDSLNIAQKCKEATICYCDEAIQALKMAHLNECAEECFIDLAHRLTERIK